MSSSAFMWDTPPVVRRNFSPVPLDSALLRGPPFGVKTEHRVPRPGELFEGLAEGLAEG